VTKLRIYIAGPISSGDLRANVNRGTNTHLELMRAGFAPLCPQWSVFAGGCFGTEFAPWAPAERLPAGTTHEDWMGVDLPWVEVSDAVLRLPGESVGADLETAHAAAHGIPVFGSVAELVAWADARAWQRDAIPNVGPAS
jgi:hypothetical protein